MDYFTKISINDWDSLAKEYQNYNWSPLKWAFRGHTDSSWKLSTNLERIIGKNRRRSALGIEFRIAREFMRSVHHYDSNPPSKSESFEWLALMQHYGAPTRLQDWTYSFFVAVYFAIRNAKPDVANVAAVWAIDKEWVRDTVCRLLSPHLRKAWEDPDKRKNPVVITEVLSQNIPMVLGITPFRLNERLRIQQGTFLIPRDITESFEANLLAMDKKNGDISQHVMKFELELNEKFINRAHRELHSMNITEVSLFPGLDGFARSMLSYPSTIDFSVFSEDTNLFQWLLDQ